MKIWYVDAFTRHPYAGNPAAVTIVADFPEDRECQQMAAEINLSETVFVKPLANGRFHIRWFSPTEEVKLCGHGTLSAAHILDQEGFTNTDILLFDSLSGELKVYKQGSDFILDFPLQKTAPVSDVGHLEQQLGMPIVAVEEWMGDVIIIELANETLIRNFKVRSEVISGIGYRAVAITARGDSDYDFVSRDFSPRMGIAEDPVTGSLHCKLADYWQRRLNKTQFRAYQASKRGGEMTVSIHGDRVHLTGNAVTVMAGQWLV